ncbi:absent in melanoma 1 protein [Stegastes partitus]|uniref:Absent in melanoma 1 protein n=2 Tax=Stegastes partitus TaxID=144197 RepID=A0A9Y4NJQ9_9TELE|nr:PREDICTED: absent in melanoma 1 protein-like [Stegastes partitus]
MSAVGKEFSYSELDLRKPKKFATFSFGLRKRKKKDEESLSSSTFGLHGSGIEEKEEHEVSASQNESSPPETTKTGAEPEKRGAAPDAVYGALYETLFPENFTSEVINSLLEPPTQTPSSLYKPEIRSKLRHLDARTEPVTVRTLQTETSTTYDRVTTLHEKMNEPASSSQSSRFPSYQTYQLQRSPEVHHRFRPSSLSSASTDPSAGRAPYSELTRLHSQVKSDGSVPRPASASPVSDSVTSQETDSQVSDSKRRVVLVRESLADEQSAAKPLQLRIQPAESLSGQMDAQDGPLSPAYLSVGSDEGSAAEIYYSAEEDNGSEDEEMFTVDEREETFVEAELPPEKKKVVFVKTGSEQDESGRLQKTEEVLGGSDAKEEESESREEIPETRIKTILFVKKKSEEDKHETEQRIREVQESGRSELLTGGDAKMFTVEEREETEQLPETLKKKVLFVKMRSEEDKSETEQQLRAQRSEDHVQDLGKSQFLTGSDAKTFTVEEKEEAYVVDGGKETELLPASGIKKVLFVKMRSEEDKRETEQQPGGQSAEAQVQELGKSQFLTGKDAKQQDSEDAKTFTVEEREEASVVESRTETELLPETEVKKILFVKMRSEEDKRETQQQPGGQKSEASEQIVGRSEFLEGAQVKEKEREDEGEEASVVESRKETELLPEVEVKKTMFVKNHPEREQQRIPADAKQKENEDKETSTVERREEASVVDGRKEVELLPEVEVKRLVQKEEDETQQQVVSQTSGSDGQDLAKSEFLVDETLAVDGRRETELLPEVEIKSVVFGEVKQRKAEVLVQEPGKLLTDSDAKQTQSEDAGEQSSVVERRKETFPETKTEKIEFVKNEDDKPEQQPGGQRRELLVDAAEKESEDKEMLMMEEREGAAVVNGRKKTDDLSETQMKSVVFVKDEPEGDERETEQQLRGQKEDDRLQGWGKSEFLLDAKLRESEDVKKFTVEGREENFVLDSGQKTELLPDAGMETVLFGAALHEGDDRETEQQIRGQESGKSELLPDGEDASVADDRKEAQLPPETGMNQLKSDVWGQKSGTSELLSARSRPAVKAERREGRREELPATPVQQVNAPQVCSVAPPSRPGEGPEGHWTETEAPSNGQERLPEQQGQCSESSHEASRKLRPDPDTAAAPLISLSRAGDGSRTDPEGALTDSRGAAEEAEHSRAAAPSREGEDSSAQSADGSRAPPVELSAARAQHPEAAEPPPDQHLHQSQKSDQNNLKRFSMSQPELDSSSTFNIPSPPPVASNRSGFTVSDPDQPDGVPTDRPEPRQPLTNGFDPPDETVKAPIASIPELQLDDWSLQATAASHVFTSDSRLTEPDQDSVDTMNSGYGSLSTKLSFKSSSPPREDETKQRFRKVSLVGDEDVAQDSVDSVRTSASEFDVPPEYRWKNRFEGVTQYRPSREEDVSDSSSSLHLPEAAAHLSSSLSSPSPSAEQHMTLSDSTEADLSRESQEAVWRRSPVAWEEPAGEREAQRQAESQRIRSRWETQPLPSSSPADGSEASEFTGVFTATLVELVSDPAAPPSTPPASPEEESPIQCDMESLVDTLKNMGPSLRPRATGVRAAPPPLMSSLPPIVEDAQSPINATVPDGKKVDGSPSKSLNGLYTLPADLGLRAPRDSRSPLELMMQTQDQSGSRGLNLPLRASNPNSLMLRRPSDPSSEDLQSMVLNGNGTLPSSRLDNSMLFGTYRSSSIDQTLENGKAHRGLFRTGSLPETGLSNDRISVGSKELGDPAGSRFDRFSFLINSSPSSQSGSLTGSDDVARMSRPPSLGVGSPPHNNSPTRLLSPTGSIDLHRAFGVADSPLSMPNPILQRSFSSEGIQTSLFSNMHGGSQFQNQEPEPDKNLASKYRAFPDAYLTKEKEHGKLNPRPGKMFIFDRPGMCGQRIEVRGDVVDATSFELQETISIRVVRGGWVLYEKPNFKGEKIALDEGDIEITYPYGLPEGELQNGPKEEAGQQNGEPKDEQTEEKPAKRFIIGSIRRAVRDYSVPEISLFPEENAEGKKVVFRDTSEDARIFGFPIKANSIIINAGLWLVYAQPFFQGVPRILEVGGYTNPAAWGVEQPYVGSLHPLKVGEPRVENTSEPKIVIYDKPYFSGKSRTITTNMKDFMTRTDRQQTAFMYSVGSLKVLGGIWVGYEKEGFRGHQYLLEEGEFQDWRVWGGCDSELRSIRLIRADLSEPLLVMFEQPEEEQEGVQDENTFEVTEAIPDVELFGYKTSTRSIHVLSGAWIAYSHVDFSGSQYILEKGFYNNCADWGSQDTRICSVQPILLAPSDGSKSRNEIVLYSEPDFEGPAHVIDRNQEAISEKVLTKSCRVSGGSWVLYDSKQYSGNMYVLSEGDYPSLSSMGCPAGCTIRSIKVVPMTFSLPSISLFGLECLEGREITTEAEIVSMVEEGFNNHILSVRVNSGCWVICEHSNFRGRQFLLEPIEITNWPKFSSLQTIGSMYPVRQKRHFFRVKNRERGHYLSVQGGVEEMKSGRVVVVPEVEPMSDIWFYQDGLIKSKLSPTMSLQVVGNVEPGAKVVLWTETRQPMQTWTAQMRGLISSLTFPGVVLDVKGGKSYDKDHVVVLPESDERPSQQWDMELL